MANPIVTPAMFAIMREALGLGVFQKRPVSNNVIMGTRTNAALIEQMIDMELLSRQEITGPAGREFHVRVTDEGVRLALDDQRRYHELVDQVKEEHKREHESRYGLSPKFPFVPNGLRIHDCVLRRMAEIEAETAK